MEAYKFITKISAKGVIKLPYHPKLVNQEVEILIFPKEIPKETQPSAVDFVNKWAGFLKEDDVEKAKLDYLLEKYR